jgi:hypothetical protein
VSSRRKEEEKIRIYEYVYSYLRTALMHDFTQFTVDEILKNTASVGPNRYIYICFKNNQIHILNSVLIEQNGCMLSRPRELRLEFLDNLYPESK